jgi:hypothetical protein
LKMVRDGVVVVLPLYLLVLVLELMVVMVPPIFLCHCTLVIGRLEDTVHTVQCFSNIKLYFSTDKCYITILCSINCVLFLAVPTVQVQQSSFQYSIYMTSFKIQMYILPVTLSVVELCPVPTLLLP